MHRDDIVDVEIDQSFDGLPDIVLGRMALARDKETEALEQKSKSASDALWRTQQILASVMPNGSGRIIDWRRM
jgi:hypothetical protein